MSYHETFGFNSTIKAYVNEDYLIVSTSSSQYMDKEIIAFSYLPIYIPKYLQETLGVQYQMPFNINDIIELINMIANDLLNLDIEPLSMNGITEITEEEFYTI